MPYKKISFFNDRGIELSGRIDFPLGKQVDAFAIFVHVFTGNKDLIAAKYIAGALTLNGIAVLRFDFTGLGESKGNFSETNFSSNVEDILAAAKYLESEYEAPAIIVGQSLGGTAAVFAAEKIKSIVAIATIGAPSEAEHVTHLLGCKIEDIEKHGEAKVNISGREFLIKKQFLDDLKTKNLYEKVNQIRKAILIMHSPQDEIVAIENAAKIYHAAHHPKSFITLNNGDHLLTSKEDAHYTGNVIASWVRRYIDVPKREKLVTEKQVIAHLGDQGYTTDILAGHHGLIADEAESLGGNDFGPSPYELLNSALAACKAMTLQMYARRKKWDLKDVKVHISFNRSYKEDCESCPENEKRIETFETLIEVEGELSEAQLRRLTEIAGRCPVHRTLEATPEFVTTTIKKA